MNLQRSHYKTELPQESDVVHGCDVYLIIDCAHLDKSFYANLSNVHGLEYQSLFEHTIHILSAEASPVLVRVHAPQNDQWLKEILTQQQQHPSVLWLWSELSYESTFNRLQSFLFMPLDNGDPALCRYYDPRCIRNYLDGLVVSATLRHPLQGIRQFAYYIEGQYEYLPVLRKISATSEGSL